MQKPRHQVLITRLSWILWGFLAFGTFLDAVANAISLITFPVALVGTVIIVVSLFLVQIYLSKNPLSWVADGAAVKISKLNLGLVLPFVGMLVLLWIPIVFDGGVESESLAGNGLQNRIDSVEEGINREVYPVINFSKPIEEQVQLFPTDKVKIYADPDFLEEVWFGGIWEPYEPDREYIVWGIPTQPITPKFRFNGEGSIKMYIDISVQYSENLDKPRDIRQR